MQHFPIVLLHEQIRQDWDGQFNETGPEYVPGPIAYVHGQNGEEQAVGHQYVDEAGMVSLC